MDTDSGSGSDAGSIIAVLTASDTGTGVDVTTVSDRDFLFTEDVNIAVINIGPYGVDDSAFSHKVNERYRLGKATTRMKGRRGYSR